MKLLSATLRNYRVHREVKIDFDGDCTLIAGLNETGKSTIAEAIHRALFLRGRIVGAILESMKSSTHGGLPEVSVRFLDDTGDECEIRKTFGRNATLLHVKGQAARNGDEAETELARRLGVPHAIQGGGAENHLAQRWAHLWITQGHSGSDPIASVSEQSDKLFARLQQLGGAALQASELDALLSRRFADEALKLWTQRGQAASNSPLANALGAESKARSDAEQATKRLAELEAAIIQHRDAETLLAQTKQGMTNTESELIDTEKDLKKLEECDKAIELANARVSPLESDLKRLSDAEAKIRQLEEESRAAQAQMNELKPRLEAAKEALGQAKAAKIQAKEHLEAATRKAVACRTEVDRINAIRELHRCRSDVAAAKTGVDSLAESRRRLADEEDQLEALHAITPAKLKSLRELAEAVTRAEATLEAMGARLQLLDDDGTAVFIGKQALVRGQSLSISDDVEIRIGDKLRLLLSPGGAQSLGEARDEGGKSRAALAKALAQLEVKTLPEAENLLQRRQSLQEAIKSQKTALEKLKPDELDKRLSQAQKELLKAENLAQSLGVEAAALPGDEEIQTAAEAKTDAENAELSARAIDQRYETAVQDAGISHAQLDSDFRIFTISHGQHKAVLGTYADLGDSAARQAKLEALNAKLKISRNQLNEAQSQRDELQPEILRNRKDRLTKEKNRLQLQHNKATEDRATAAAKLHSDGSSDPAAAKELADAELRRASRRADENRVRAEATKLLAELYQMHQREVAEQSARPLAEAAARYLAPVLGAGTKLQLKLEPGAARFSQASLSRRDGSTFAFEQLSGGAREQVGVALRLAMTETLAADHGGCLPVVLDDAFVNSDAERVPAVRDMLALAESRGLQVIILSCHPEQYSGMGWNQHQLKRDTSRTAPLAASANDEEDEEEENAAPSADLALAERLLDLLKQKDGNASSSSLRKALGCELPEFQAARDELVRQNLVKAVDKSLQVVEG